MNLLNLLRHELAACYATSWALHPADERKVKHGPGARKGTEMEKEINQMKKDYPELTQKWSKEAWKKYFSTLLKKARKEK